MGNWYTNITTRGPAQADVSRVLARLGRRAYLTPTVGDITVVFDQRSNESADLAELGDLALTLSGELGCHALAAAVFDDDVLLLAAFERGAALGEYNSAGRSTLAARTLARAFPAASPPLVWCVPKSPPLFVFESVRHRLLLRALRQPPWAYGTGYKYIKQGEAPPGVTATELVHVDGPRHR